VVSVQGIVVFIHEPHWPTIVGCRGGSRVPGFDVGEGERVCRPDEIGGWGFSECHHRRHIRGDPPDRYQVVGGLCGQMRVFGHDGRRKTKTGSLCSVANVIMDGSEGTIDVLE